jgi:hypothetical protein
MGSSDNPKVNAVLLVEGGLKNTHYKNHQSYLQELNVLREEQYKAQMEAQEKQGLTGLNYDYYSDEDDVTPGNSNKGIINSFLEIRWGAEIASLAFLFVFFSILQNVGSAGEAAPGSSKKIRQQ